MDEATKDKHEVHSVRRGRRPKESAVEADVPAVVPSYVRAQDLATRIWNGQSPDLPRADRLRRVEAGLSDQGLPMDGVVL